MAKGRPRRAFDDAPPRTTSGRLASVRRFLVDGVLWTLGGLGLVSLLAAIAAHVWGFSIVLFSTGSMTPTIPAGSAALVRLLPASALHVGDVTTVERKDLLPITHRITSIKPVNGQPDAREITMRGDANELEDPNPYLITQGRLVIASVPGIANVFQGMRNPLLMGGLTILAGLLVSWAFWPRQTRKASVVAAAAIVAGSSLLGATDAQAAESEHEVIGRHMVLTVISDADRMSTMLPGLPVFWQVGVTTRGEEEGALHIGLSLAPGTVAADALTVDVMACPQRWQGETCAGVVQTWVSARPLNLAFLPATHSDAREFATTPAGTPLWILVRATLNREAPDVKATMRIAAWGGGEVVEAVSDGNGSGGGSGHSGLAYTGSDGTVETLALAGVAVVSGLVVSRLAGGRRRGSEDREVVR
jgi:signal peptidase